MDRIGDRLRLLVNFLHHEVLKSAFFRRFCVPVNVNRRLFHQISVQIVKFRPIGSDSSHFQVVDIDCFSGVVQNRGDIRSNEIFSRSQSHDEGSVFSCQVELVGVIPEHDGKRIGAAYAHHGLCQRVDGAHFVFFVVVINELDNGLRIRVGVEGIVIPEELLPNFLMIFKNAVVYGDHVAVVRTVRVCIVFGGDAVCGPPGVSDAAAARDGSALICLIR